MRWEVILTGDQADLEALSESLASPELTIARRKNEYVLRSTRFEREADSEAVWNQVDKLISRLNGACRLELQSREPIEANMLREIKEDGPGCVIMRLQPAVIRVRGLPPTIITKYPDGTTKKMRPADRVSDWVRVGGADTAAEKVLRLLHSKPRDWVGLYRIYEVIEGNVGGRDAIGSKKWVSRNALTLFRRTANSVEAAGDGARHGSENTGPPPKPMSLAGASEFIRKMARGWLDSKASQA